MIAPDALIAQWKSELATLFGLKDDPRLRIVPFTGLETASRAKFLAPSPTLVVVDEAHLSASWAFPPEHGPHGQSAALATVRYRTLEELARCPKLLLMSGTPVLHHEDGFLAMLHLLDPDAYDLKDREGFRMRVASRTAVANALSHLTADYQADFLTDSLAKLSTEIDSDDELTDRIRLVLGALVSAPSDALRAIEELRSYLLERYRLHRRIIRTHRESKAVAKLLPRRCGLKFFPTGEDPIRERAYEALDAWRAKALDGLADSPFGRHQSAAVFGDLLSSALTHPLQLGRAFLLRAASLRSGKARPAFDGEASWLGDVASEFLESPRDDKRTAAVAEFLRAGPAAQRRAVVFVDTPEMADLIVQHLSKVEELRARVLRFWAEDANCVRSYQDRTNAILICDRNAEEGLNLQRRATTIVFYDLPFDIGRIEQRIGRFDRLEGMRELSFFSPEPVGSYERGWHQLLAEQVRIFDRSVARLQYVLSDEMAALRGELLEAGPVEAFDAIARRFADPKAGLDSELKRLRRQEVLDATEWDDAEHHTFADLVATAREGSGDEARDAIEGWLKALQFEIEDRDDGVAYTYVQTDHGSGGTLMPLSLLQSDARHGPTRRSPERGRGDSHYEFGPFAFDSTDQSDVSSLLGIGHSFFDSIVASMRLDDRSRSWAMWRYEPRIGEPAFYVRFDFAIEASLAHLTPIARKWKTATSLRRRADQVLPVEQRTVWMDIEGKVVNDYSLLKTLSRPYARNSMADKNLDPERWAFANRFVPVGDWGARILRLRRELEDSLRAEDAFQRRCKEAEQRVASLEHHAIRILRSRAAHAPEWEHKALEGAMRFETEVSEGLRMGVRVPALNVDNVGVIVLAPTVFGG